MTQLSFDSLLQDEKYRSVTEVTRDIKALLESTFVNIWVEGEISNFTFHSSGHMYFSLKDGNAQIPCVMWRSKNYRLFFTPQDGMKVLVNGRLSVYEKRGAYQIDVQKLQPAGLGELQAAFEQLKSRLAAKGLFDQSRKKAIPPFPRKIGLVTSPTGAAVIDILTVFRRRFPAIQVVLAPARVQGDGAAHEIAAALEDLNHYGDVDLIIVARGGGSLEDLWAFNEEIVAQAVNDSDIPVVSAVGHEVDYTICDFTSDLRAPTPSAAAELVVPSQDDMRRTLHSHGRKMTLALTVALRYKRDRLSQVWQRYGFRQPLDRLVQSRQRLDELRASIETSLSHRVALLKVRIDGLTKRLLMLEHGRILKRGYSMCFRLPEGILIDRASNLSQQDEIEVSFCQGKIKGTVSEVTQH